MIRRIAALIITILILASAGCASRQEISAGSGIPNLPRPIATDRVLVTTAGQGAEGLIVSRYLSQLNIRSYYRHRAEPVDLQDVNSLIIVIGFSPNGLESAYMDVAKEKRRLRELVYAANLVDMPIILVHISGMERRSAINDDTARELIGKADYLVVLKDSNQDGFFTKLSKSKGIPFTEVSSLSGIKVPLNSAYR